MIVRITSSIVSVFLLSDLVNCSVESCNGGVEVVKNLLTNDSIEDYDVQKQVSELLDNRNSNFNIPYENYTVYDKIFWIAVAAFIICTIYIRAKTNYRVDYPDEVQSRFLYAVMKLRKILVFDPYLDSEMKKREFMKSINNGPQIALWILWFNITLSCLNSTYNSIEDLTGLMTALLIYFVNIVVCCVTYDICISAPLKYYE